MPDFTKGKWSYADVSTPYEQHFIIGTVDKAGTFYAHASTKTEADARLFSAAHDMYMTLKKVLDDTQNGQFASESEIIALLARIDGKELPAMTQTLKPCPFCGGSAKIFYNNDKEHTCYIECGCCFVRTDDYYDKKYLVKDWNRRYSVN